MLLPRQKALQNEPKQAFVDGNVADYDVLTRTFNGALDMERADLTSNRIWLQHSTGTGRCNRNGWSVNLLGHQHLPQGKQLMDKALEQIVAQGPLAAAMAVAIWWLASKIKDCEIDRQRLWDKISEIAQRHNDNA